MVSDVVVIGASVAGPTTTRRLATEGFSVAVPDSNQAHATAAIGHGVTTYVHVSTAANMTGVYGDEAAWEHVRRNLAGLEEIRGVAAVGALELTEMGLYNYPLGVALDRELNWVLKPIGGGGAEISLLPVEADTRVAVGLRSPALLINPADHVAVLGEQAETAGMKILHDVTVTRIRRLDGVTQVVFRRNLVWSQDLEVPTAHAVAGTLAVSPWGSVAGVGQSQYVPTLQLWGAKVPGEVTLLVGPPTWLIRPIGEEVLLLGPKCARVQVAEAAAAFMNWAATEFGACDVMPGQLIIDPSDHGRPVVGVSTISGGFYIRGNGRSELMNGTALGCHPAALLLGVDAAHSVLPPWASEVRTGMGRLLRRR